MSKIFLPSIALLVFFLTVIFTYPYLTGPCQEIILKVRADVDGRPIDLPVVNPIEVKPGELITMIAEVETEPEMCEGELSAEWQLPFTSDLAHVKFTSQVPVTLTTQVPEDYSEEQITVTVLHVLSGSKPGLISQRFKVKGE